MNTHISLRLDESLMLRLDMIASQMQRTRSDVIRMALEYFANRDEPTLSAYEQVADLIGSVQSNIPDLGERHREHLIRKFTPTEK